MKIRKMLQPIQKDHELICPGCGCVLGNSEVTNPHTFNPSEQDWLSVNYPHTSYEMLLLGSALENNAKYSFQKAPQQVYEEHTLKNLILIIKEFALPESIAVETFNVLKKKNRGFRSEKEPIKQLLKILSKDDNYIHIHKMRAIKKKYEDILNS